MDGRIVSQGDGLGSGFCLTDRIVATAAHVVRGRQPADLHFVVSGRSIPVEEIQHDPTIDAALLRVAESVAVVPSLAHATLQADWRVTARPQGAAVQLTGLVSALDHLVTNASEHDMTVLQLNVTEQLRDFTGYSGSAVTVNGSVVGMLVEQVLERDVPAAMMRPLATNVLFAVPVDRIVRRFKLGLPVTHPDSPPPVQQLLDTAYFDLDRLKTAIVEARSASTDRLLGFGVDCDDLKVVRNLCTWLPPYLGAGDVVAKSELTLRPELISVDAAASRVTRYFADLERINVVCPVLVDRQPAQLVAQFWERVQQAHRRAPHWLVLFFAGTPVGGYPPTVTALPRPSFVDRDILTWAQQVLAHRRWPQPVAGPWSDQIIGQATLSGELDIRLTYEALEDYIKRLRLEPAALLGHLEGLEDQC